MSSPIVFRGTNIWDASNGGIGWSFEPSPLTYEIFKEQAPLGTGFWIKGGSQGTAEHSLKVVYLTNNKLGQFNQIQNFIDGLTGSLTVPDWGTFNNCMLTSFSCSDSPSNEGNNRYFLEIDIKFEQYPAGTLSSSC